MSFGTLWTVVTPTFVHPRSRKAIAVAKLNGLDVNMANVEFGVTNKTDEYKAKHPRGTVPAFEAADGSGLCLSESNAIAQHFAASGPRAEQLLGANAADRARIQEWVFWQELQPDLHYADLCYWRLGLAGVAYDEAKETAAAAGVAKHFGHLESQLAAAEGRGSSWLVAQAGGDAVGPSLADIVTGSSIAFLCTVYMDKEMRAAYPHIMAHLGRLQKVEGLTELLSPEFIEVRKQGEA